MVQQIVVKDRTGQYAATRTIKASWPNRTSLATKTERASRASEASWTNGASRASICSNYSTAFMATIETRNTKAISRLRAKANYRC